MSLKQVVKAAPGRELHLETFAGDQTIEIGDTQASGGISIGNQTMAGTMSITAGSDITIIANQPSSKLSTFSKGDTDINCLGGAGGVNIATTGSGTQPVTIGSSDNTTQTFAVDVGSTAAVTSGGDAILKSTSGTATVESTASLAKLSGAATRVESTSLLDITSTGATTISAGSLNALSTGTTTISGATGTTVSSSAGPVNITSNGKLSVDVSNNTSDIQIGETQNGGFLGIGRVAGRTGNISIGSSGCDGIVTMSSRNVTQVLAEGTDPDNVLARIRCTNKNTGRTEVQGGTINIGTDTTFTNTVNIATAASTIPINIGSSSQNATVSVTSGGTLRIGEDQGSGDLRIGRGTGRSGRIQIGENTDTGDTYIYSNNLIELSAWDGETRIRGNAIRFGDSASTTTIQIGTGPNITDIKIGPHQMVQTSYISIPSAKLVGSSSGEYEDQSNTNCYYRDWGAMRYISIRITYNGKGSPVASGHLVVAGIQGAGGAGLIGYDSAAPTRFHIGDGSTLKMAAGDVPECRAKSDKTVDFRGNGTNVTVSDTNTSGVVEFSGWVWKPT